jgi:Asp-tRNA(Asn)/Glu-tRNA(Gln) amidotransferase A subunit family amidase
VNQQLRRSLDRIAERDAAVLGWVYVDPDARQSGDGLLSGVTVGVKDVIDIAGMVTTHGSPAFAGNMAHRDAEAVRRMRAAGAIILGKTVTAEFATYHPGPTINPRKPGHTPGGSSSGSAAVVADGQADIALGTQTAGSMIRPASFCGTLGFKPSFGRYPLAGVLETSPNLDTLGVFGRTLDLVTRADAVLSGEADCPPANPDPVIGLCHSPAWDEAEPAMQKAFLDFAKRLQLAGHRVDERDLPNECVNLQIAQALIHRREAWMTLGHIRRDHADIVSPIFRDFIDSGERECEADYQAALGCQAAAVAQLPTIFAGLDMLLVPGACGPAPKGPSSTGNPAFQRLWTALGAPCLGFPVAWQADGLPLGLQIIGKFGADRQLLADATTILAHAALKPEE